LWAARRLPALPRHRLSRRAATDVVVVGAGISGAMVADALSEAGLAVLVVDRRPPFAGSTAASTALLQYEIDTPLTHLAARLGERRAIRVWRRSKLALDALRERVRRLALDADCTTHDSLYLDGDLLGRRALAAEGEARRRAGFEVSHVGEAELRRRAGIVGRTALVGHGALAADPRRLAHGFLAAALARGARLASPVEVVAVDAAASRVRAHLAGGAWITARWLVFATGYELARRVPRRGHWIASTWAFATRPQRRPPWPGREFIWEAADPYLYLRVGPGHRVICGGADEPFADAASRDALLPAKVAVLQRKLRALMPDLDVEAEFAWCGSFGGSATGTPTIGAVPGLPHCFAVLGYGGNGITFSALAAQLVRTAILGGRDPDADLFAFRRRR